MTARGVVAGMGSTPHDEPSSGLPFAGSIFYGARGFVSGELSNSIKIKGLAVGQNLWRAV
jgi:hypothetical protein